MILEIYFLFLVIFFGGGLYHIWVLGLVWVVLYITLLININ